MKKVSSDHSWYKHLTSNGTDFMVYMNPVSNMNYTKTDEYRKLFGYLSYTMEHERDQSPKLSEIQVFDGESNSVKVGREYIAVFKFTSYVHRIIRDYWGVITLGNDFFRLSLFKRGTKNICST